MVVSMGGTISGPFRWLSTRPRRPSISSIGGFVRNSSYTGLSGKVWDFTQSLNIKSRTEYRYSSSCTKRWKLHWHGCNSIRTKHRLQSLHKDGIEVLRHSDHIFFEDASQMIMYWAHHEKLCVVDESVDFIGARISASVAGTLTTIS